MLTVSTGFCHLNTLLNKSILAPWISEMKVDEKLIEYSYYVLNIQDFNIVTLEATLYSKKQQAVKKRTMMNNLLSYFSGDEVTVLRFPSLHDLNDVSANE